MMGWYNNGGMSTGGWISMILMMTVFWGLVIFAGVMLFRGAGSGRGDRGGASDGGATYRDPVDILNERFARGELENEDYAARKAVLLADKR